MPATYEPIATTTLGSAASSITFSSIAGTYTDLRVVYFDVLGTGITSLSLQFNADTGTNYSRTTLYGDGTSAGSGQNTAANYIQPSVVSMNQALPSFYTMDIFSYAGSTYKTTLITTNQDYNGSGRVGRVVGLWRNTAAITEVKLSATAGSFAIGSTATLYGIKNA